MFLVLGICVLKNSSKIYTINYRQQHYMSGSAVFSHSVPGTLRRLLRLDIMLLTSSGNRVVCWFGLKVPDTSFASSLFVAIPAHPVRPSLLWMASLSSAATCEPIASHGWIPALSPGTNYRKNIRGS